jgi:hypothetical protein
MAYDWSGLRAGKFDLSVLVLWVVTPCGLIGRYQCFGGTYCLHLHPWRWRHYVCLKCWCLPTSPQGITTQKTNTDIFTAMRTSNFIQVLVLLTPSSEWSVSGLFFILYLLGYTAINIRHFIQGSWKLTILLKDKLPWTNVT